MPEAAIEKTYKFRTSASSICGLSLTRRTFLSQEERMTQLTHIQPADLGEADQALKTKHRAVWASGNYAAVVTDIVSELVPDPGRGGRDQARRSGTGRRDGYRQRNRPRSANRRTGDRLRSHARTDGGRQEVGR